MDLSPIQPDWVPENAMFVVDDIEHEAGWTYGDETFDYIHIRHTVHSIQDRELLWERIWKYGIYSPLYDRKLTLTQTLETRGLRGSTGV